MDDLLDDSYLNDLPLWYDDEAKKVLSEVCERHKIPIDVLTELVILQRERGSTKKELEISTHASKKF